MNYHGYEIEAPEIGIVLGSGLSAFAAELAGAIEIPYARLPDWPQSTAIGHAGMLVFGRVAETPVAVLSGRAHLYEGYTAKQVVHGVRELHRLGAHSVVLTNAAGGIRRDLTAGTLALISDHINLQGANPLTGPNDETLGPRFPDMTEAYSKRYRAIAQEAAGRLGINLPEAVYAALAGPSYETPAEIRYLRAIGADLVGMSTVPEVIAANHMGMKCLAISCVSNAAAGITGEKLDHEEVLATGRLVQADLVRLLKAVVPALKL